MRSVKRVLLYVILITIFINIFYLVNFIVNASTPMTMDDMTGQVSGFLAEGKKQTSGMDTSAITGSFVELGRILTIIGAGVMVAVTAYMGIKYIMASPEGQAKLKQQLIGLVVAGIVIFGAYGIWNIVLTIVQNFE